MAKLEEKHQAHDRLLAASAEELERQGRIVARIMRESEDALRESHHDIQVGVELQMERLRIEMREQAARAGWLQKENRVLAFGLAVLLVVCWLVSRVTVDAMGMVALVSGIAAALGALWAALNRGAEKARKDSIAPPRP